MENFHFLRPFWLLALLPLALVLWMIWQRHVQSRSWQRVVDPRLLPHLLIGQDQRQRRGTLYAIAIGGMLSVLALAGPAWRKLEQPVFRQQSALVLILDLARSMDAQDIKPSRLQRAELKLRDILAERKEGETALIVYSAIPFVVTPLTDDSNTIASQISSMTTDLMPVQGARPDLAIAKAQEMLYQAGVSHGGVLLISDGIGDAPAKELGEAIDKLASSGHKLSILAMGTPDGAPVRDGDGDFVKDRKGSVVLTKLDDAGLTALVQRGGGAYRHLSADDSDFHAVLAPLTSKLGQQQSKAVNGLLADQWHDEGPWLLIPVLLLASLCFRRGYMLIALFVLLPQMRPANAADWHSLWQNNDQQGQQALSAQQPQVAAQLFQNPEWRAAANYRAGNYQAALDNLKGINSAEADYNRGNALAKLGRFPEAINAYDQALKLNPKMEDAQFNRDLLAKQDQQKQQPKPDNKQNDKKQDDKQDKKDQPQGNKGDKQNDKNDKNDQKNQKDSKDQKGQKDQKDQKDQQQGKDQDKKQDQKDQQNPKDSQQQNKQQPAQPEKPNQPAKPDNADKNPAKDNPQQSQMQNKPQPSNPKDDKNTQNKSLAENQEHAKPPQNADEKWLRRIPDDPGELWRNKFLNQYKRQQLQEYDK